MKSNEYLDKVKAIHQLKTDTDLAVKLGTSKQMIHSIRSNKCGIRGDLILSVARALKMSVAKLQFEMNAEHARSPEAKQQWHALSRAAEDDGTLYIMLSSVCDSYHRQIKKAA